jgi:biotin carboxylase
MNTSHPVLIIAGGVYQLPLIEACRQRGLPTVVLDGSNTAPGLALADEGLTVDLVDHDAVIRVAREVKPCAVAAIVSEVAVTTVSAVANALGLPGLDRKVAEACTDKYVMRRCFETHHLPVPPFMKATSVKEARNAAASIGYPLIVKPVDSSGSRGVQRVDRPEGLDGAVQFALSQSHKGMTIIEGFLDGVECTVETFSSNGETEILGISEKVHVPFPYCVSIDLTYPPSFPPEICAQIAAAARAAVAAVGLQSGPGHIEVMLTRHGPVVIELAARGGGYRIFSDILFALSGVDPVSCVLDQALGNEPTFRPTRSRAAVLRFFNPPVRGVLRAVCGVEHAKRADGILDVVIEATIGKPYRGITRDGERPGYLISTADTREEAVRQADAAERLVEFQMDEHTSGPEQGSGSGRVEH